MRLDIRLPIGALFTLLGVFLAGFGATGDRAIYQRSLGINVNLGWGLVLLAFGLTMLALARHRSSAMRASLNTDLPESTEKIRPAERPKNF